MTVYSGIIGSYSGIFRTLCNIYIMQKPGILGILEYLEPWTNTGQKWQQLPLLDVRMFAPKFDFFNFSVLTKIVENENFN